MQKGIITIPNMITLCNLLCGVVALRAIFVDGDLNMALWLVIAAAVFDFFDGLVARLLNSQSPIGKELDSLADVVSFGVVPSAIAYTMILNLGGSMYVAAIGALIALCSALRLAKFNVDEAQSYGFIGMPTPANALFFASLGAVHCSGQMVIPSYWIVVGMVVVMSLLLISSLEMFALKFKDYSVNNNKLRYGFIVLSVVLLVVLQLLAIPAIIALYIIVSIVASAVKVRCK